MYSGLFVSEVEVELVTELWKGALQGTLKLCPTGRSTQKRDHSPQVLIQLDVSGIGREPLMMPPFATSRSDCRVEFSQLIQYSWGDTLVNNVIGVMPDNTWAFYPIWSWPTLQSKSEFPSLRY